MPSVVSSLVLGKLTLFSLLFPDGSAPPSLSVLRFAPSLRLIWAQQVWQVREGAPRGRAPSGGSASRGSVWYAAGEFSRRKVSPCQARRWLLQHGPHSVRPRFQAYHGISGNIFDIPRDVTKAIWPFVFFFYHILSPNFTHITNASGESISFYFVPAYFRHHGRLISQLRGHVDGSVCGMLRQKPPTTTTTPHPCSNLEPPVVN